jgi:hypothetical protein
MPVASTWPGCDSTPKSSPRLGAATGTELHQGFVMPHNKCRTSFEAIECAFPHHIEIVVPLGGLGRRLDAMYVWHRTRGIQAMHGRGRRENGRDIIRWCFADPAIADAFTAEFVK